MCKIMIINTGGTIAMSNDMTTGSVMPTSENPLNVLPHQLDEFAELEIVDFDNIPSPHMTPAHMLELSLIHI